MLMLNAIVGLGGWIVVFMTRIRRASSFGGGATATGFWGGMTVGRLVLGFLTGRIGEFKAVIIYLTLTIALQLIFWLVSNLIVSAVSVALLGVFIGKHHLLSNPFLPAQSRSQLTKSPTSTR